MARSVIDIFASPPGPSCSYSAPRDPAAMSFVTVLLAAFGGALVAAYALWDLGADQLLANFGCVLLRVVTLGRVRLSVDQDYSRAMGISAITLLVIFIAFVLIASRVH